MPASSDRPPGETEIIILQGLGALLRGPFDGGDPFPIRVLAEYGIESFLTNAAGGINRKYQTGMFMAFKDHLNFMGDIRCAARTPRPGTFC